MSPVAARIEHVFPTLFASQAPRRRVQSSMGRLESLAWFMDEAIPLPGTSYRIGGDVVLGLVPGVGSLAAGLVQLYVVVEAMRLGIPRRTLARMVGNVALDTTVGAIPIAGNVFDVFFKATRRNVTILMDAVTAPR